MKYIILTIISAVLRTACTQQKTNSATGADTKTDSKIIESTSFCNGANVNEAAIYSRAFNAVDWGMPAVNLVLMHQSLVNANVAYNQVVYWSGLVNDKNQTLTPNPNVIYINPFYKRKYSKPVSALF